MNPVAVRARAFALSAALGLGACATAPAPPASAGDEAGRTQWLELTTVRWVSMADPGPGRGWTNLSAAAYETLSGAQCTARNDRGTWTVTTPARVPVTLSANPLTVVCRHPGYREETRLLRCLTPATRAALAATGMVGIVGGPLVLLMAPLFGAATLVGAAEGPEDGCNYATEAVKVEMTLDRR